VFHNLPPADAHHDRLAKLMIAGELVKRQALEQ
jgi:hypothetical protein